RAPLVWRRLPRGQLPRPAGWDVAAALRVPADRPDGDARRRRRPRPLPVLRRSVVRHRRGLSARRWSDRGMKLAPIRDHRGDGAAVLLDDGARVDASAFVREYDEAFFGGDGV